MPDINFLFREHYKDEDYLMEPSPGGWPRAVLNDGILHLRKLNGDESDYSPDGNYYPTTVILPKYYAQGLTGFYAFKHLCSGGGEIGYQLSNNGGVTWYTWDSDWVPAQGVLENTYMPVRVVDENIRTFPVAQDRSLRIKVRLNPSPDGKETPYLHNVIASVNLSFDYQIDFLQSMKLHLERTMKVRTVLYARVNRTSIAIPEHQWDGFENPVEIYNTDTDPDKTTNLFKGFYNNGFELSSNQTGLLEIHAFARPTVIISGPEAWMEVSKNPAVVINDSSVRKIADLVYGEDELEYRFSDFKARKAPSRVYSRFQCSISVQSTLKRESEALADALERSMNQYQYVHSYGSGEFYKVLDPTPITLSNRIAVGLFVKDYASTIVGRAWLRPDLVHDVDLVRDVRYITSVYSGILGSKIHESNGG